MMSSADEQEFSDQLLIRYLLGSLPEQEAERLDELSISDDAFAWRLSAVENDLVDAYARGEFSGGDLAQFKKSYLSSPKRLQKVQFAEALRSFEAKAAAAATQATRESMAPGSGPGGKTTEGSSPRRWFAVPRLALQWGFASGALVMLLAASYLLIENTRLRKRTNEAQGRHAASDLPEQELQRQLKDQRAANAEMAKELDRLREAQPNLDQFKTLSALLLPPTRGAGRLPTLSVPQGTNVVVLLLMLEADDFPEYRVNLKDPATSQSVWHSANLKADSNGADKTVSVSFPAHVLRRQNYVLELSGVPSSGRAEFISGYPVHVVIR
jgi:hypothetical protein